MIYELVTGTELNDKERWKVLMCANAYYKNSCSTCIPNCHAQCLKTNWQHYRHYFKKWYFLHFIRNMEMCLLQICWIQNVLLYVKVSLTMYANTPLCEHKSVPLHFIWLYAKCIMHVITSSSEILYCMNAWSQRFLNFCAAVNYQWNLTIKSWSSTNTVV